MRNRLFEGRLERFGRIEEAKERPGVTFVPTKEGPLTTS
jgi:hypothetical protein